MKATLGGIGVVAAFVASVLGALSLAYGLIRKRPVIVATGYRFVPVLAIATTLSVVAMEWALLTHDFSLAYVAKNNALETPLLYTFAGMWASLEGSILLWGFVLVAYLVSVTVYFRKRRHDPLVAWATVVMFATSAFFFLLMIGPANPFKTLFNPPLNGDGPNPLLQNHPLMAIHPPVLYAGYVGMTVPFAFALAALITGRVGEGWLLEIRRWTLGAWGCLTIGIGFGAWWSYEVLGWGGFWGWDAVENASLLPWLTATAFIHSVLVQERRAMLRVWNLSLICATFSLTILGTFLTRSGVISSVHAFSNSKIGPWLISFFAVVVLSALGLIAWRGDELRSTGAIDSPISREGAFLANNILFGAFAFVVLLGTVFPLLVEAWNGDRLSVGAPYFDTMSTPLGLLMLFLMAIAPVLPWRKASTEVLAKRVQWPMTFGVGAVAICVAAGLRGATTLFTFFLGAFAAGAAFRQLALAIRGARARGSSPLRAFVGRANGGMIVHLGVIMIAVAISASRSYASSTEFALRVGEKRTFNGHEVELVKLRTEVEKLAGERVVTKWYADVRIDGGRIDSPAITRYDQSGQAVGTPSVQTGAARDLYLTYVQRPETDKGKAIIAFYIQPMIVWLWIGLGIMGIGTILAMVPGSRRRPTEPTSALVGTADLGEGVPA
jgi:cytochrome c-type biogenesis protein CcmF